MLFNATINAHLLCSINNGICQHPDYAPIKSKLNYNLIKGLITNYTNYTPSSN